MNVFLVLAFLMSSFFFWKVGKEEHYREDELFDGFLLSFLTGIVFARIAHVVIHFSQYGWQLFQWFNVFSNFGFYLPAGLVVFGISLYRFAGKKKWEQFAILDMMTPAVFLGLAILQIGVFFEQPLETIFSLKPWFFSLHLVISLLAFFFSWYTRRAEFHYRTYSWYRSGRQVAQTGFVLAIGLVFLSLLLLLVKEFLVCATLFVLGLTILIGRSGFSPKFWRSKNWFLRKKSEN